MLHISSVAKTDVIVSKKLFCILIESVGISRCHAAIVSKKFFHSWENSVMFLLRPCRSHLMIMLDY